MPSNDISLCSEPGGDTICNYCIRNPKNTKPDEHNQAWLIPNWNTFDNYCDSWLVYKKKEVSSEEI